MSRPNPGHENRLQVVAIGTFPWKSNFSTLNAEEDCLGGLDSTKLPFNPFRMNAKVGNNILGLIHVVPSGAEAETISDRVYQTELRVVFPVHLSVEIRDLANYVDNNLVLDMSESFASELAARETECSNGVRGKRLHLDGIPIYNFHRFQDAGFHIDRHIGRKNNRRRLTLPLETFPIRNWCTSLLILQSSPNNHFKSGSLPGILDESRGSANEHGEVSFIDGASHTLESLQSNPSPSILHARVLCWIAGIVRRC
jgi:hypothetical protein